MNDLISRQAAIDEWKNDFKGYINALNIPKDDYNGIMEYINEFPSAQPEIKTDGDTISRQAAVDALDEQIELCNKALGSFDICTNDEYAIKVERASLKAYREQLENLPSAQPEIKTGRWIKVNGYTAINCSACYHCSWSLSFEDTVKKFSFCPNCGAKMLKEGEE